MFGALISIKNVAHFKLDKAKQKEVTHPLEGRAKYGIGHGLIITREQLRRDAGESPTAKHVSILYICRVLGHLS